MAEPDLTPDTPGYIEIATVLAKVEMRRLNDDRAIALTDAALPQAQKTGNDAIILDLLITRGVSLSNVGRSTEAVVVLTGAVDVAGRQMIEYQWNRAAVNLGYALAPDDPARSFAVSRAAIERSRRVGVIGAIRYILGNAVDAAIEVAEWDWAMEQIAEMDAILTEPAEQLWFGTFKVAISAYRGEDVLEEAQRLYRDSRGVDDAQYRSVGAVGLAVAEMLRGNTARVAELAEEDFTSGAAGADSAVHAARVAIWNGDLAGARRGHLALARMIPGRRTTALKSTVEAGIAMLDGRSTEARALYSEAHRMFRELETPFWIALVGLDIILTGAMEADERRRAADEAREIFTRLRASALLDRLDAALAADVPLEPTKQRAPSEVPQEA